MPHVSSSNPETYSFLSIHQLLTFPEVFCMVFSGSVWDVGLLGSGFLLDWQASVGAIWRGSRLDRRKARVGGRRVGTVQSWKPWKQAFVQWRGKTLPESVEDESCSSCRDLEHIGTIRRNYPNLSSEIEVVKIGNWKARKDWSPENFSRMQKTAVEGNKAGRDGTGSSEELQVALWGSRPRPPLGHGGQSGWTGST